jgi:hypothetical protein
MMIIAMGPTVDEPTINNLLLSFLSMNFFSSGGVILGILQLARKLK